MNFLTNTSQYHVSSRPRHLRCIFFIGENYTGVELKTLMVNNLQLWGGRYNPIVPVIANAVSMEYKKVCQFYDPDFVFYTSSVSAEELQKNFDFNPAKFLNLNDHSGFMVYGVNALCFQSEYEKNRLPVLSIQVPVILKDFYWFNFLATEQVYKASLTSNSETFTFDSGNSHDSMSAFFLNRKVELRSTLSSKNLNTAVLRDKYSSTANFEIVVSSEKDSSKDLLYYWNRQLFISQSSLSQIIVSKDELIELLKDEYFIHLLYKLAKGNQIDVTSFTLDEAELKDIVSTKIQPVSKGISFQTKIHLKFPFDILDANGLYERNFSETVTKQAFLDNKGLFYFPPLSFPTNGSWAVDVDVERIEEHQKQSMKFSTRTEHQYFLKAGGGGRINKKRGISVFASNSDSTIDFKIPPFTSSIKQIIQSPKFYDKLIDSKFKTLQISSEGSKLLAFINLFHGNLHDMETLLYDKFWFDLIVDLSSNIRISGNTIRLTEIKQRCIEKMALEDVHLVPDSYKSEKNLEKGIRYAMEEFCEKSVFFIGFNFSCPTCSSKFWYSLEEIKDTYSCKGCGKQDRFPIEEPFSYRLNDLVKNNFCYRDAKGKFKPEGNITVLKSLIRLSQEGSSSFEYSPQLDLYEDFHPSSTPVTDLDIIGLPNGKLVIGEAKHSSSAFKENGHKPLKNLIEIAKIIQPDRVVIACSEDSNGRLEREKQFLKNNLKDFQVDAFKVTDPYYQFDSHLYFHS